MEAALLHFKKDHCLPLVFLISVFTGKVNGRSVFGKLYGVTWDGDTRELTRDPHMDCVGNINGIVERTAFN